MAKAKDDKSSKIILKDAVQGKVCTRFPPEPSGYLHLGHAKAAFLNDYFAKQYDGKMILRFDDTNPSAENDIFVKNMKKDLDLLDIKYDKVTHTSDSFDIILQFAIDMLKERKAYVDNTDVETMRKQRLEKKDSACRNNSIDKNLELWNEMQQGTEIGLKCALRAKLDMKSNNGCLRDPVIFRCDLTPHHKTGNKYKVYPTYDFSCPIVDSIEGVTHALRTSEYADRDAQYAWFQNALNIRKVPIWSFSRLNFKYTLLSKRKLAWFVNNNLVKGWDDPRMPTIQGILRRGLTVESLRDFIIDQGPSTNDNLMEWDKIWSFNCKRLNDTAFRYTVVNNTPLAILRIKDDVKDESKDISLHPKLNLGTKKVSYSNSLFIEFDDAKLIVEGEEVTLLNWGNVIIDKVSSNKVDNSFLLEGRLHLEGSVKSTKKKLTWIDSKNNIPVKIVEFDHLITIPSLKPDQDFKDVINQHTEFVTEASGEPALKDLKKGSIIQLLRRGFYICEQEWIKDSSLILYSVPDGKLSEISVISSKVAKKL